MLCCCTAVTLKVRVLSAGHDGPPRGLRGGLGSPSGSGQDLGESDEEHDGRHDESREYAGAWLEAAACDPGAKGANGAEDDPEQSGPADTGCGALGHLDSSPAPAHRPGLLHSNWARPLWRRGRRAGPFWHGRRRPLKVQLARHQGISVPSRSGAAYVGRWAVDRIFSPRCPAVRHGPGPPRQRGRSRRRGGTAVPAWRTGAPDLAPRTRCTRLPAPVRLSEPSVPPVPVSSCSGPCGMPQRRHPAGTTSAADAIGDPLYPAACSCLARLSRGCWRRACRG